MDEQRLHRVAGAVALCLGIIGNAHRLVEIGTRIDVDVTNAVEVLDHRHFRVARDALDQSFAAARDDHVDMLFVGDQMPDGGAIRCRDHLHGGLRQSGASQSFVHTGGDRLIAA